VTAPMRTVIDPTNYALSYRSSRWISSEPPGSAPTRPAETLFKFAPKQPSTNVIFHNGGWIASGVPVQLLFWGGWWDSDPEGSSRRDGVIGAVQRLLDSPYLWELAQYRASPASYRGATTVLDPPPPNPFTAANAADLVWKLIDDNKFPETDDRTSRIAHMIFLPKGTTTPGGCGAHGPAPHDEPLDSDPPAWYAWIGYDTVDGMTSCFSHELAELMVDPELDAWHVDGVNPNNSEIGDLCDVINGWVNGVFVRAYWSKDAQKCVIPTDGRMLRLDGNIIGSAPREVASGPFTPPAPTGIDHFIPACHLEGKNYTWHLSEIDQTAELNATAGFFNTPAFEWSVGGVKLSAGAGRVSITTDVTREAAGGSTTATETVDLAYRTHDSYLELSNDSVAGNMDVPVTVVVYDQAGADRPENPVSKSVVVSYRGSVLSIPDYANDIQRCQRAANELWKETHKAYKHGPIGPLNESDREFVASQPGWVSAEQLQRTKNALAQAEAIGSLDRDAGLALRQILLDGLRMGGLSLPKAEH
jgi:hypothetical protein